MHEAARAIDIDPNDTAIGLSRVKEILKRHGWIGIAPPFNSECWHHDWRGEDGRTAYESGGYREMARRCIARIGNVEGKREGKKIEERTKWVQESLNRIMNAGLKVDGDYGNKTRKAVKEFQKKYGLCPDGVVGPITEKKLRQL